jgi:predicted RNA-binding Zn-ribbon protein involved in translation (DUF1610 family)
VKIKRERSLSKFISVSERMTGPRVLVADIETLPILAYVWGLFKQNISLDQIAKDWAMMSFAAKWLDQPEVFYLDNRDRGDPWDDSMQLHALWHILEHTDMVVAHNGLRFDLPKIKARLAINGFKPLQPIQVIDTLLLNRGAFGFTSQKLQYVSGIPTFCSAQKDEHNEFPGWKLWLACMADNIRGWKSCEKYNIQDVVANEGMYLSLRGWYRGHPNMGVYHAHEDGKHNCPTCGSTHVVKKGVARTQVGIYQRYRCNDCHAPSRGRFLIASRDERSHILMN